MPITLPSSVQNAVVHTVLRGGEHVQAVVPVNAYTTATGNITATGQTVQANCVDANFAVIAVTGTFSLTLAFEVSLDGSNWFPVQATRVDSATIETSSGAITAARAWEVSVAGFAFVRARCTAYTSGTGAVAIALSSAGADPAPAVSLASGSNLAADVGMQYRANATGAALIRHIVSAASTNATSVKASAGRVVGWSLANTTASWRFVKLHNTASTPTAGSGVVQTIAIPPNGLASWTSAVGIAFTTGIGLTIVTGAADTDATAVAANDVVGDLFYM